MAMQCWYIKVLQNNIKMNRNAENPWLPCRWMVLQCTWSDYLYLHCGKECKRMCI